MTALAGPRQPSRNALAAFPILAGIGTALRAANSAAAAPITGVVAAAEDEVSAAIASLFTALGQQFQELSAQAAALPCSKTC